MVRTSLCSDFYLLHLSADLNALHTEPQGGVSPETVGGGSIGRGGADGGGCPGGFGADDDVVLATGPDQNLGLSPEEVQDLQQQQGMFKTPGEGGTGYAEVKEYCLRLAQVWTTVMATLTMAGVMVHLQAVWLRD